MNEMQIQALYTDLNTLSLRNDWPALEQHFLRLAEHNCGSELASRVQSIDLSSYIARLQDFLKTECMRSSHHAVKALYFQYDLDRQWNSQLLFCDRYSRFADGSETWARHWIERITGPDLPQFAAMYQQHGGLLRENPGAITITFALLARTTAAFGRAIHDVPTHKMSICIGHTGQERMTRIYER